MENKPDKIEIFQIMRAIAAIGIVYFHTEYGIWHSANWGIDFFFILSGFMAMLSTKRNKNKSKYWISKVARICPLYYIMTILVAFIYMIAPTAFRSSIVTWNTLMNSFLFIPCYARNGKINPVYSLGWTLNYEMFFYIIFFIAMKINHKFRGMILTIVFSVLIGIGIVISSDNAIVITWTNKRLINFVVGICLYYVDLKCKKTRLNKMISIVISLISIILLFTGKSILKNNFIFLWNTVWSTILMTVSLLGMRDIRCHKLLVGIGNMSYSIYLTHFPIIGGVCRIIIDNEEVNLFNTIVIIFAVMLVMLVSKVVYEIFEVRLYSKIKNIINY